MTESVFKHAASSLRAFQYVLTQVSTVPACSGMRPPDASCCKQAPGKWAARCSIGVGKVLTEDAAPQCASRGMIVQVEVSEQQAVLSRRRGSTLSRKSILKGYLPQASTKFTAMNLEGVTDIRHAHGLPVYTMGTASIQVWC